MFLLRAADVHVGRAYSHRDEKNLRLIVKLFGV